MAHGAMLSQYVMLQRGDCKRVSWLASRTGAEDSFHWVTKRICPAVGYISRSPGTNVCKAMKAQCSVWNDACTMRCISLHGLWGESRTARVAQKC